MVLLNKDFREFVALLNENEVRYLVVGGYAVAVHGHPRYTKDLDVWVEISPENAGRIVAALDQFGFGSLDLSENDFLAKEQIIQLGHPPNRIDILTTVTGLEFEECYENRMEVDLKGLVMNFIDLESLKKNKKATRRYQDLADLEALGE